jgi:hypothetical protein
VGEVGDALHFSIFQNREVVGFQISDRSARLSVFDQRTKNNELRRYSNYGSLPIVRRRRDCCVLLGQNASAEYQTEGKCDRGVRQAVDLQFASDIKQISCNSKTYPPGQLSAFDVHTSVKADKHRSGRECPVS